uniref:Protein MCM10 homolog n=1 Tax=Rhabditophanes sp. KR3021 TaxID=114890 RepID=A0AC35UH36_9BILA
MLVVRSLANAIDLLKELEAPVSAIYDPYFGIKVREPSIAFKTFDSFRGDKNKVKIGDIKKGAKKCEDGYVTMGVIIEKSDTLKSSKGKDYMIWKLSGFENVQDTTIKALLFGDCVKSHWKMQVGSVVVLVNPKIGDQDKKDSSYSVMLYNAIEVIGLGFCPDYGVCGQIRKDGSKCPNVINNKNGVACIYHIQQQVKQVASRRGTFNTEYSQPNVLFKKKQMMNCVKSPEKKASVANVMAFQSTLPVRSIDGNIPTTKDMSKIKEQQVNDVKAYSRKRAHFSKSAKAIADKLDAVAAGEPASKVRKRCTFEDFLKKADDELVEKDRIKEFRLLKMSRKVLKPSELAAMMRNDKAREKNEPVMGLKRKAEPVAEKTTIAKKKFSNEDIMALLNKKSSHQHEADEAEVARQRVYFNHMEGREKVEEYATNLMEIPNFRVFTCTSCNLTHATKNEICAREGHQFREHRVTKRFFKCKDCSRRCTSFNIYPKAMCAGCKGRSFVKCGMKDERIVKPKERLLIRGQEIANANT